MSLYDYTTSLDLTMHHPPFYGLIMTAMRQADSVNLAKLITAWPDVYAELRARYDAPGGKLPDDPHNH